MANQEIIELEFPVPVQEEKVCKYCYKSRPILYEDLGEGGYFHKDCLEKHIQKEIREALKTAKVSYSDLKPLGRK